MLVETFRILPVKQFEFRLQSVLRLKTQILEMEELRLQKLFQAERNLVEQLRQTAAEVRQQQELLFSQSDLPGAILGTYAAFQKDMQHRMEELNEAIQDVRQQQTTQREKIRLLRSEREMLERLRNHQFREWLYQADREAEALAHESHLNRLVREQSSASPGH